MIDHLVYATPNLEKTVADIAAKWGVQPTPGGKHAGRGTHNALLSFGDGSYLELIGPDPDQPEPPTPRGFGIETLLAPKVVTWAAKAPAIGQRVAAARAAGYDPGEPQAMSRDLPSGDRLAWTLTRSTAGDGLVPFLIDWGETVHPSITSAGGCRLLSLRALHPRPAEVLRMLKALGEDLPVEQGPEVALIATVETPNGTFELR
jgi:hypothetical protein